MRNIFLHYIYIYHILFQLYLSKPMDNFFFLICTPQTFPVQITSPYSTSDILTSLC